MSEDFLAAKYKRIDSDVSDNMWQVIFYVPKSNHEITVSLDLTQMAEGTDSDPIYVVLDQMPRLVVTAFQQVADLVMQEEEDDKTNKKEGK